jgi:hypothetical protein
MLGGGFIPTLTSATIREEPRPWWTAVMMDRACDAQPQQHALRSRQQVSIALSQPNTDALCLSTLDAAVGVEQTLEQAPMKIG